MKTADKEAAAKKVAKYYFGVLKCDAVKGTQQNWRLDGVRMNRREAADFIADSLDGLGLDEFQSFLLAHPGQGMNEIFQQLCLFDTDEYLEVFWIPKRDEAESKV